jgi:UDP-glucose 4-epimerase
MSALIIGTNALSQYIVGDVIENATRAQIFDRVRAADRVFHLVPFQLDLTQHTLDACEAYDRPLLIASSSEVYGRTVCGVARESDPLVLSPSTAPSTLAMLFAERAAIERGLRVVIARLFDLAVPGTMLGRLLEAARSNRPLRVFGTGLQERTYLHAEDAASILVRLMETPAAFGGPVNVGGTCAISLHDLARRIQQLTRSRPPIVRTHEVGDGEEHEDE